MKTTAIAATTQSQQQQAAAAQQQQQQHQYIREHIQIRANTQVFHLSILGTTVTIQQFLPSYPINYEENMFRKE
jgi:hypothetical protein